MENTTNETTSVETNDEIPVIAGHILLVFYCLLFVFGFIGEKKQENLFS